MAARLHQQLASASGPAVASGRRQPGRLYAMGVDAYSLAPRLNQLKALPDNRVEGLSGSLTMNPSQRVERQLPWAEFSGGQVKRLPDTPR